MTSLLGTNSLVSASTANPAIESGRNDVVYLAPAAERFEALPLGNGRLGATVWNDGGMSYQLNHGSFHVDEKCQWLLSSGRVDVRFPKEWMSGWVEQRLSLADAAVFTHMKTGKANHRVSSWFAEGLDLLIVKVESDTPLPELSVDISIWEWREGHPQRPPSEIFTDESRAGLTTVGYTRRIATTLLVETDAKRVSVAKVDDRRARLTIPAQERRELTVYIACPVVTGETMDAATSVKAAREIVARGAAKGIPSLWNEHLAFWKNFWGRTRIVMQSADGFAEYAENLYYLHLYWVGSSSRGEHPPLFDGALWLLLEDMRSWGGFYWYQNMRQLYWPLLASDHADLWKPFLDFYWNNLPAARKLASDLGVTGACYEETLGIRGDGDKRGAVYTHLYHTTGTELAFQWYQYYLFTRDETFLRDKAYPLMKEVITYHLNYLQKEDDGLYHVYPSNARETWWWVKDSITDLTALRATLPILIGLSERLGTDADERARWKDVLDHLAPYVRAEDGTFLQGTLFDEWPPSRFPKSEALYVPEKRSRLSKQNNFNGENVENEPIYPWGLVGLDSPAADLDTMRRTFAKRRWPQWGGGWEWGAVAAARLGLPDESVRMMKEYCHLAQEFPSGMARTPGARPKVWGGQLNAEGGFDGSGVFATTITEMMLQGYGGKIRVFPAWPKGWQGEFTLVAEGGFVVNSAINPDGSIPWVRITSQRGGDCLVVNPWNGTVTRIPTRAGQRIELRPDKQRIPAPRITMTRNTGPKWMQRTGPDDTLDAFLKRNTGFGVLGIAADGTNPARVKVRKALAEPAQ